MFSKGYKKNFSDGCTGQNFYPENAFNLLSCKDIFRLSKLEAGLWKKHQNIVTILCGEVYIVCNCYNCLILPILCIFKQVVDSDLVLHVQETGWLIQKEYRCLLSERTCDKNSLSLSAGETPEQPVCKFSCIGLFERFGDNLPVAFAREGKRA